MVVVHGGAGVIPAERSEGAKRGVCAAARAGYVLLQDGASSVDAVVEAVVQLENNSMFNAGDPGRVEGSEEDDRLSNVSTTEVKFPISGCGSVLNVKGEVEMDALLMDGQTLACGAVAAVRNMANPIQLSRLVMEKV